MIKVINCKKDIPKNLIILNLSDEYFKQSTYDISLKIQENKKKYTEEYLNSFDSMKIYPSEQLTYTFSYLSWRSYFIQNSYMDVIYYFIFLDFLNEHRELVVYIKSNELIKFIQSQKINDVKVIYKNNYRNMIKSFVRPYFYIFKLFYSKIKYGKTNEKIKNTDVLIYSYVQDRCLLNNNGWNDPFLGDLYNDVVSLGYNVKRFAPIEPMLEYEHDLRDRNSYIISMISYLSTIDIFKILFKKVSLKNTINNLRNINIAKVDFSLLYKKHLELFVNSNNSLIRYTFYYLFKKLIKDIKPKIVIYLYENQPWEKSINKICSDFGVTTIAINHSMISSDMFNLYNSTNISTDFYPDYLIANGKIEFNILKDMNSYSTLKLIGSKRHIYPKMKLRSRNLKNLKKIAIVLSGVKNEFLDVIKTINQNHSELRDFTFYLKPPPGSYYKDIKDIFDTIKDDIKFNFIFFHGNLDEVFDFCEIIMFISTTVGIEAYIENKICLRYIPSYGYDLDMTESIENGIYQVSNVNFINVINSIDYSKNNDLIKTEDYFKTWDKNIFNQVLNDIFNKNIK